MFDDRMFWHSYDLYRPALTMSEGAEQKVAAPGTPTATNQPCRFIAKAGNWRQDSMGVWMQYQAVLLVPPGTTLKPEVRADLADQVVVMGSRYSVLSVHEAGGAGLFLKALLSEVAGG